MKRKREKYQIPYRVNLIFLVVFVLFSVLILRLGLIQIVYGENYSRKVEKAQNATVSTPVPRGKMYDRYNRVIVDNTPLNTITYTRFQGNTTEERLRIAKKLATMLDIPYTTNVIDIPGNKKNVDAKNVVKITERDMKDYWITIHPEKAEHKITKTDRKKVQDGRMTDAELYKRQLERISKKDLESLKDDLEILAIKRQMEGGYSNTPKLLKAMLQMSSMQLLANI